MVKVFMTNMGWFSDEVYAVLNARLSEEEKEEVSRFRFSEDRKRGILSKIGLYEILKSYGLSHLELTMNQYGKKQLKNNEIKFNVSHSGSWVVHAVSDNEVGVDIEEMKEIEYASLGKFFSKEEERYLSGLPKRYLQEEFYRVWTAKEAYVKYLGKGLSKDLKSFCVLVEEDLPEREVQAIINTGRVENYILSVCTASTEHIMLEGSFISKTISKFSVNKEIWFPVRRVCDMSERTTDEHGSCL